MSAPPPVPATPPCEELLGNGQLLANQDKIDDSGALDGWGSPFAHDSDAMLGGGNPELNKFDPRKAIAFSAPMAVSTPSDSISEPQSAQLGALHGEFRPLCAYCSEPFGAESECSCGFAYSQQSSLVGSQHNESAAGSPVQSDGSTPFGSDYSETGAFPHGGGAADSPPAFGPDHQHFDARAQQPNAPSSRRDRGGHRLWRSLPQEVLGRVREEFWARSAAEDVLREQRQIQEKRAEELRQLQNFIMMHETQNVSSLEVHGTPLESAFSPPNMFGGSAGGAGLAAAPRFEHAQTPSSAETNPAAAPVVGPAYAHQIAQQQAEAMVAGFSLPQHQQLQQLQQRQQAESMAAATQQFDDRVLHGFLPILPAGADQAPIPPLLGHSLSMPEIPVPSQLAAQNSPRMVSSTSLAEMISSSQSPSRTTQQVARSQSSELSASFLSGLKLVDESEQQAVRSATAALQQQQHSSHQQSSTQDFHNGGIRKSWSSDSRHSSKKKRSKKSSKSRRKTKKSTRIPPYMKMTEASSVLAANLKPDLSAIKRCRMATCVMCSHGLSDSLLRVCNGRWRSMVAIMMRLLYDSLALSDPQYRHDDGGEKFLSLEGDLYPFFEDHWAAVIPLHKTKHADWKPPLQNT
jgi:hypothetical protein